jgi:WD40 repeat protein
MAESVETAQPYVGPRPFRAGEPLFGRDRERDQLLYQLIAERIVLLYSPSGAGKTSLIEAGLVPALERRGFRVLPRIRVGQALPEGVAGTTNRFVYSTLVTLEQQRPPEQRLAPDELLVTELTKYLAMLAGTSEQAGVEPEPVLIFDQFEELLTVDSADVAAKREFFRQLGTALENRRLWALFALREDFLAALDPYLDPIPNRFRDHFRLTLLAPAAARMAVEQPVKALGAQFEEQAVTRLIDDLRLAIVPRLDGGYETTTGTEIEPVQLQVVCLRLWQNLASELPTREQRLITVADVEQLGDVNQALAEYYAEWVAKAAAAGAGEHAIRVWFTTQLITPDGRRNKVIAGTESSAGLSNAVIDVLVDAHLVRAEGSRNMIWYELAHDRLIAPVKAEYQLWSERNLSTLQRTALVWDAEKRPARLLLRGAELRKAHAWYRDNQAQASALEREFLDASDTARSRRVVLGAALLGLVLVAVLAGLALLRSQQDTRVADVLQTAALALEGREEAPQRSILLALLAREQAQRAAWPLPVPGLNGNDPSTTLAEETLRQTLATIGGTPLRGHLNQIDMVAFSPDGRWIATASLDGTARLWDITKPEPATIVLKGHSQEVVALAFSPDSRLLVTASDDNTLRVWQVDTAARQLEVLRGHSLAVLAVDWSPDGRWIASASQDGTVRLWDAAALDQPGKLIGGYPDAVAAGLRALAFGPENRLAVGFEDGSVLVWDVDAPGRPLAEDRSSAGTITAAVFSPDGRFLATTSDLGTLVLWDLTRTKPATTVLQDQGAPIFAAAFKPDSSVLAVGGLTGGIHLWQLSGPKPVKLELPGGSKGVTALAYSARDGTLAAGHLDGSVYLWPAGGTEPIVLRGHTQHVGDLAFSSDGRWLASASWEGLARLWRAGAPENTPLVLRQPIAGGLGGGSPAALFDAQNRRLVTLFGNGAVQVWALDTPELPPVAPAGRGVEVSALALNPDGHQLAIGSRDGVVQHWDIDQPTVPPRTLWQHDDTLGYGRVAALAFSPDGRWLASGSWDGTLRLGQVGQDAPLTLEAEGLVRTLAFSADSTLLAAGGNDRVVRVWRVRPAPGEPEPLEGHTGPVSVVAFSPDGRWLASGGDDAMVRLWRLGTNEPPIELRGHEQPVVTLAFSPDGRWLASGGSEETARLWSLQTPSAEPQVLRGHTAAVRAVAFSPDGALVATAGDDGVARIWRLALLDAGPVRLRGHQAMIAALTFSPASDRLATASADGTTRVWDLNDERLVRAACQAAGRNFTLAEWQQFVGPRQSYKTVCASLPRDPSLYRAMLADGEITAALQLYEQERKADPALEPPAAWLLWSAGNLLPTDNPQVAANAAAALRQALVLEPELETVHALALNRLCAWLTDERYAADVIRACDAAVKLDPAQGNFHYNRARIREQLGDRAGAAADLCDFLAWAKGHPNLEMRRDEVQQRRAALVPGAPPCPTQ